MPHLKSAYKNIRKSRRKAALNLKFKKNLRKALKVRSTAKNLPAITKAIDKAARRKIISRSRAARLKSRLSKNVWAKGPSLPAGRRGASGGK